MDLFKKVDWFEKLANEFAQHGDAAKVDETINNFDPTQEHNEKMSAIKTRLSKLSSLSKKR